MKLALTTALIASLSAPAFAGASDFARAHFAADDTGLEARIVETTEGVSERAAEIFNQLAAENVGNDRVFIQADSGMTVSTKGGHNAVAQAIFDQLAAAEDAGDR